MSVYNSQIQEWTQSLCSMTIGASIAALVLVPPVSQMTPVAVPKVIKERIEIITTIPDGTIDPRTLHYSTSCGLNTGIYLTSVGLDENEESESNNLPRMVREISGLPVDTLADLVGVSRVSYHKWLVSGGVKPENVTHLRTLLDTFQTLRNLRVSDIRMFLESDGPAGKPLDLLASGDTHAVIGLALRSSSQVTVSPTVSQEARQFSGLAGWVRPAKRLNWNAPWLTDVEREEALDRLSPRPLPDEVIVIDDSDEDH